MGSEDVQLFFLLFFLLTPGKGPLYSTDVTVAPRAYPLARGPGSPPWSWALGSPHLLGPMWHWLPLGVVLGGPGSGPPYEVDLSFSWSQILGRTYWVAGGVGLLLSFPQRAGLLEAGTCCSGSLTIWLACGGRGSCVKHVARQGPSFLLRSPLAPHSLLRPHVPL